EVVPRLRPPLDYIAGGLREFIAEPAAIGRSGACFGADERLRPRHSAAAGGSRGPIIFRQRRPFCLPRGIFVSKEECAADFVDLITRDRVQEIYQIDDRAAVGSAADRLHNFAAAVATNRDHSAMRTIDNEITEFRQVHPGSWLESVDRKGVIGLFLTRHRRSQVTT